MKWLFRLISLMIVGSLILVPVSPRSSVVGMPLGVVVTPDTFYDDFDSPGDFDSMCSLREALYTVIRNSNYGGCVPPSATWGKDRVELLHGTYQLTIDDIVSEDLGVSGDLDIYPYSPPGAPAVSQWSPLADVPDITIQGATTGSNINGNSIDRVLQVHDGISVGINQVMIYNGLPFATPTSAGGGIYVAGTLTMSSSTIYGNTTQAGGSGAGIYNTGTLTLNEVLIQNNWTGHSASATSSGDGGGVYNNGVLVATDVFIFDNATGNNTSTGPTGQGGGLSNYGEATFNRVTVSDNLAGNATAENGARGGGIYNGGDLTIRSSTISGNRSGGGGLGGGNYSGGMGGAIFNGYASATLVIEDSTIAYNWTGNSSGSAYSTGGGLGNAGGSASIENTILANNEADYGPECYVSITSIGYNLVLDDSGCTISGVSDTIIGQDPLLGPLTDAGGRGWVHPLRLGSPAIDAGPNTCLSHDQRHLLRPKDGNGDGTATCDIGAYEAYKWVFSPLIFRP
jgi:hypothetical protein